MQSPSMVHLQLSLANLHCMEGLHCSKKQQRFHLSTSSSCRFQPKLIKYRLVDSFVWVWVPKAAETFPIKVVNFLHVGFVFLSLSSFFLGGTRATVIQERPGQQKEGACGRRLSVRKRLSELFTGASYERHEKLWKILVLFNKQFPALLFYDDQSFLCTEIWVCIQFLCSMWGHLCSWSSTEWPLTLHLHLLMTVTPCFTDIKAENLTQDHKWNWNFTQSSNS